MDNAKLTLEDQAAIRNYLRENMRLTHRTNTVFDDTLITHSITLSLDGMEIDSVSFYTD